MAEEHQYFNIRSQLNALVLDVKGSKAKPGTPVVTWHPKSEDDENQEWYEDEATGTIRSRLNDFCLDLGADGELVMNQFVSGSHNQQWTRQAHRLVNKVDSTRILEIADNNASPGAAVKVGAFVGGANQKWDYPRRDIAKAGGGRAKRSANKPFFIRSAMHGKVLDVQEASKEPGAAVVVWSKKATPEDNQLWATDEHGIIRSKLNGFALTASSGGFKLHPYDAENDKQQWTYEGTKIFNKTNPKRTLDISGEDTADGAKVIPYGYNGGANQQWYFDHV